MTITAGADGGRPAPGTDGGQAKTISDGGDSGLTANPDLAGTDITAGVPPFAFRPSNITLEQLGLSDTSTLGDAIVDSDDCSIWAEQSQQVIMCTTGPYAIGSVAGVKYLAIGLNQDPPVDVWLARSWTITSRTTLPVRARTVLVALGDIVIEGQIRTGFIDVTEPGLGAPGDFGFGASGGSFCGQGGTGAYSAFGRSAGYGTAELIPPRIGSSGGPTPFQSGLGGGFIQLVAFGTVNVRATGRVLANGGGGYTGGGGGSGGGILIEAISVIIDGVLAANGGAGGTSERQGQAGAASGERAAGGVDTLGNVVGGAGAAGIFIDGADALSISVTAGGGGGAGRIRINTAGGDAAIGGTVSPALSTPCAAQGQVHPF